MSETNPARPSSGRPNPGTRAGAARGHGWWPYVLPYFAFLGVVELCRVLPAEVGGWVALLAKPAVPAGLLVYFAARGAYPELRGVGFGPGGRVLDAIVGVALAALWMAPYLVFDAIRPADPAAFDPEQLGPSLVGVTLGLRMLGYALVTPVFEELFIRSFVMRYSEVFQRRGDFRRVPLARFTLKSFTVTVVLFTLGHQPWEWWVAIPWVALSNLWFYYRKDLYAVIVLHGATNASILLAAWLWSGRFVDASGAPLSLWFFV